MAELPRVSAIVLAYGAEPTLEACVQALLGSEDVVVDVLVVDNLANRESLAAVRHLPRVTVLEPGRNTGFAGGCNYGASAASAPVLAFVNSDAVVDSGCLRELAHALDDADAGLVCASVRIADHPGTINAAGNPVHFLYFSWAGGFGEEAADHGHAGPVASITGATFAARREFWQTLGGFDDAYFVYCEDVDLSMRTWQAGRSVRFVPTAISLHHYEFNRTATKFYYLERNRLINLLTLPETRTLLRISPLALGVEAGLMAVAVRGGWARQKLDGYRWLIQHAEYVRRRRREVQGRRVRCDEDLAPLLSPRMDVPEEFGMAAPEWADRILAASWRHASRPRRRGPVRRPSGRARRSGPDQR